MPLIMVEKTCPNCEQPFIAHSATRYCPDCDYIEFPCDNCGRTVRRKRVKYEWLRQFYKHSYCKIGCTGKKPRQKKEVSSVHL